MKQQISIIIVGLSILTIVSSLWWLSTSKKQMIHISELPIKVCRYYWPGMYWIEIAKQKGWFKEAGLNVQLVNGNVDYYESIQNMVDGKLDSNGFYLFDVMAFNAKGADLVIVINTDNTFGSEAIVAHQNIQDVKALKGKRIGVKKNTYMEYILDIVLKKNGLTLTDVVLIDISGENAPEAFVNKMVDAIITWEPLVSEAIQKGNGIKLFDTSQIYGIVPGVHVFKKKFIRERPGAVQAYVNVWYRTIEFIKLNPEEAFKIIADIYNTTPTEVKEFAQKDLILDLQDNLASFTYAAGFKSLHGSARKINDFMIQKKMTTKHFDSTEFINAKFIRTLNQNLR
ncbi:aliphatic sulfonate ABC transporter substrate-binding protein [Candidatus Magnetomorum sp. HK-1]|nr:aliphatic sulfonate ABC transporter substrate-binding protein [Candidatus Magnetomorum sp. HK-1]